jgi:HAD superfamily hydrolase (TIGR01549 family)
MTTPELAIFDLDGVLIDSKELHFEALNEALREFDSKFEISHSDHSTKYDGLSTRRKLEMLHSEKGFPIEHFERVWKLKQDITLRMLGEIKRDEELVSFMAFLQNQGIKLAVASNSVRNTIDLVLRNLGIIDFFSLILSNEDVRSSKPHPEIYWKTMMHFEVVPDATVIFEDSYVGRLAALRSGARLIPIENRRDLTWQRIRQVDVTSSTLMPVKRPWKSDKLNVLIPMAGAGSRFEAVGYTFPKPLIEVRGKPMIQVVVENLNIEAKYIYIVQRSHFEKYNLDYLLRLITPNCEIVQIEGLTEGAACTTLLAREFIDNEESLVIANSDQFVEWNSGETLYSFMADGIDGGIVTFKATHPKWSYARIDESGIVQEVAEKKPISDIATVGIYFWKKGSDYVKYADEMIEKNIRTNGEFYVCPVFNQAIEDGKKFRIRNIDQMWGLGTPEDLNYFLENHN